MKSLKGETFISMENGSIIRVLEDNDGRTVVATVTLTGALTNQRPINSRSLHLDYKNTSGNPWKTGYVLAEQLPDDHEFAFRPARAATISVPREAPAFEDMSTVELMEFTNRRLAEARLANDLAEKAKEEIRNRAPRNGVTVLGGVAMAVSRPQRFDPALAKERLNANQYAAICVTKADATKAKKILGEDSPLYKSLCTEGKARLEIRSATDADYEASRIQDTADEVRDPSGFGWRSA